MSGVASVGGTNNNPQTTSTDLQCKEIGKKIGKCVMGFFGGLVGALCTVSVTLLSMGFVFILAPQLETHSWTLKLARWAYNYFN